MRGGVGRGAVHACTNASNLATLRIGLEVGNGKGLITGIPRFSIFITDIPHLSFQSIATTPTIMTLFPIISRNNLPLTNILVTVGL